MQKTTIKSLNYTFLPKASLASVSGNDRRKSNITAEITGVYKPKFYNNLNEARNTAISPIVINMKHVANIYDSMKLDGIKSKSDIEKAKEIVNMLENTLILICATHLNPTKHKEFITNNSKLLIEYSKLRGNSCLLQTTEDFMCLGLSKEDAKFMSEQIIKDNTLSLDEYKLFFSKKSNASTPTKFCGINLYKYFASKSIPEHRIYGIFQRTNINKSFDQISEAELSKAIELLNSENTQENATKKVHLGVCQIAGKDGLYVIIRGSQDESIKGDLLQNVTTVARGFGNVYSSDELKKISVIINKISNKYKINLCVGHSIGGANSQIIFLNKAINKDIPIIGLDSALFNPTQLEPLKNISKDDYVLFISPKMDDSSVNLTENMLRAIPLLPKFDGLSPNNSLILAPVAKNELLDFSILNGVLGKAHGKFENMTPIINSIYRTKEYIQELITELEKK